MRARNVVLLVVIAFVVPAAGGLLWLVLGDDGSTPAPEAGTSGSSPRVAEADRDNAERAEPVTRERQPRAVDAPADGAPWVSAKGFEEPLAAIDWAEAGQVAGELVPLLADAALAAVRADDVPSQQAERAVELRATLAELAGGHRGVFPSAWGSGAITHPAFAANLIAATLHARGGGLSSEQLAALEDATRGALEAELVAASEINTTSFTATRMADEFDRRSRFFDAVDEFLTEKQRTLLHAEAARGRVRLDPISAAALWDETVTTQIFDTEEFLLIGIAGPLLGRAGFDPEHEQVAFETLRSRIEELDDEMLPPARGFANVMGFVPGDLVARWARWNSAVLRDIVLDAMEARLMELPDEMLMHVHIMIRAPK